LGNCLRSCRYVTGSVSGRQFSRVGLDRWLRSFLWMVCPPYLQMLSLQGHGCSL